MWDQLREHQEKLKENPSDQLPAHDLGPLDPATKRIYFPCNPGGNHWVLCVVDVEAKTITTYNPLRAYNADAIEEAETVEQVMRWYGADPAIMLPERWSLKHVNTGLQQNGSDCGVWMCMIAAAVAHGQNLPYDVSEARHLMATLIVRAARGEPVVTLLPPTISSRDHVAGDKVDDVLESDAKLAAEWQELEYNQSLPHEDVPAEKEDDEDDEYEYVDEVEDDEDDDDDDDDDDEDEDDDDDDDDDDDSKALHGPSVTKVRAFHTFQALANVCQPLQPVDIVVPPVSATVSTNVPSVPPSVSAGLATLATPSPNTRRE